MTEEKKQPEIKRPTTADIKNKFLNLKSVSVDAAQAEKIITGSNVPIPTSEHVTEPAIKQQEIETLGKKDVGFRAMDSILKKNRMSEMSGNSRLKRTNHEWLKALSTAENVGIEVLVNNILDLFKNQNNDEINKCIRQHLKKF